MIATGGVLLTLVLTVAVVLAASIIVGRVQRRGSDRRRD
jgi:hypothetical protein